MKIILNQRKMSLIILKFEVNAFKYIDDDTSSDKW